MTKRGTNKFHFGLAAFLILVSCAKKEDEKKSTAVTDGTWAKTCVDNGDGTSTRHYLIFSGSSFNWEVRNYGDTTCTTTNLVIANSGTFTSGATTITTPSDATSLDNTTTASIATATTAAAVSGFNAGSTCGYTDWVLNTAKTLVGKTCFGTTWALSTNYNIHKISGTSLTLGDETAAATDGSTAAKRPTAYESTSFTKQ